MRELLWKRQVLTGEVKIHMTFVVCVLAHVWEVTPKADRALISN